MRNTESASSARRAQGEESRERLVQAAIEAISERGYAATSVGEICRRAGVAKTALYWHFESKEGLLAVVIERVGDDRIERLQKQVYLHGEPFDRIDQLMSGWREILRNEPQLIRLPMMVQLGAHENSDSIRTALRRILKHAKETLIQGIEDSLGMQLRDLDMVANTILALFQGALLHQVLETDDEELDRIFEEIRRTIILAVWDHLPADAKAQLPLAFESASSQRSFAQLGLASRLGPSSPPSEEPESGAD